MFKRESITSFERVKLRVSGMRLTEVYEIICHGDNAQLSLYWLKYETQKDCYDLQQRVTVPAIEVIDLLNKCAILKWDGFSGKNPRGVLDGTMFGFSATVNGGRKVRANGSNNFPRRYRDFTDELYRMLYE